MNEINKWIKSDLRAIVNISNNLVVYYEILS